MTIGPQVKIIIEGILKIQNMVSRAAKGFIMAHVFKNVRWEAALGSQPPVNIDPLPLQRILGWGVISII